MLRADKVGRDTMLSRIVDMVARAQRSRAPIQRLADQVAGWFVPAVIATALLAFVAWGTFGPEPRFTFALVAAVTVLIIACPCALGLATPMSIMVGVGRGARSGILIRDAEALQRFESIDTIVIDKTGTLTEGKPKVVAIVPADGIEQNELLRLAASVERGSEHPLAHAILDAATEREIATRRCQRFCLAQRQGRDRNRKRPQGRARQCDADGGAECRHRGSRRRRGGRATAGRHRDLCGIGWPRSRRDRDRRSDQAVGASRACRRCAATACAW